MLSDAGACRSRVCRPSTGNVAREWPDVRVDVEVDEGWNVGWNGRWNGRWNERWNVGWNLETVATPHEYGCGTRNGMRWRSLISAVALTLLAPAPGLAQGRTWEWDWGMHPMMFMWGAGGLVMMLMMLVFWT